MAVKYLTVYKYILFCYEYRLVCIEFLKEDHFIIPCVSSTPGKQENKYAFFTTAHVILYVLFY